MNCKSAHKLWTIVLCCASFFASAQDDGLQLLQDADDNRVKFEHHYFEALKYKAIGNYSRAITELENCQQLYKDELAVDFELAKNYYALKQFNEAQLYIEKVLSIEPDNYWFLKQAKLIYLKQYNYKNAISIQEQINEIRPNEREDLVLIYIQANERDKARSLVEELEKEGLTSSKLSNYGKVLSQGKDVELKNQQSSNLETKDLESLKKSYSERKEYAVLREILIQEFNSNRTDSLLKYSAEALELFPAQPYVYLMNAKALNFEQDYDQAVAILAMGLDFIVDDRALELDFYQTYIDAYQGLGEQKKVDAFTKKIEELKNNSNEE